MIVEDFPNLLRQLSTAERRVLQVLKNSTMLAPIEEVTRKAGFRNDDETYSAASWLAKKDLVEIKEQRERLVWLGPEGKRFLKDGFPEANVLKYVSGLDRRECSLEELGRSFKKSDLDIALAWWKKKDYGRIEKIGGRAVLIGAGAVRPPADEAFLQDIEKTSVPQSEEVLRRRNPHALESLSSRPGVLEIKETKRRVLALTPRAAAIPVELISLEEGLTELTPELLKSGAWKGRELRPYDLGTPVPRTLSGKPHPLVQIIEEIRDIFVQLGFQEIEEDFVQSAFWNMDALFIPQDHPAREMQDTFYLQTPSELPVEDELIERIGRVHMDGGDTGSRGWGQPLDPAESRRALLRTHTTVGTIRHLAAHPTPPVRVFSIGRVFRKETMDATHLPEFHQIEGIATEEGADFPMLLGILKEFYRRLGFEQLRWRPAYFPYTEPSMEVEVWTGKKWMELGGCGIFRPEVAEPFGVKTPVLAWGLGLERLAMLRLGLSDIRDLYISDLEWLRSQPLL